MIDYSQFNEENLQVSRAIHLEKIAELDSKIVAFTKARRTRQEELDLIEAELENRKEASG